MTVRALLVGIERYPKMEESLAASLPGTVVAAARFREWLITQKGVAVEDIQFCSGQAVEGRTSGATYEEIVDAIDGLLASGQDHTEELYCFFSCHGFAYRERESVADVIVCADYRTRDRSGNVCLRLDEVQDFLQRRMGPGSHYYFVDACRTVLDFDDIVVGNLPLIRPESTLGSPGVYTLYSTQPGSTAAVASGFADVLLKGLSGFGRAKAWVQSSLAVQYVSLVEFVEQSLPNQEVDQAVKGPPNPTILAIKGIPQNRCEIAVVGAGPGDRFDASVTDARGRPLRQFSFDGPRGAFVDRPDDYSLEVKRAGTALACIDPQPVDLYEPNVVHFSVTPPPPGPTFAVRDGELTVEAPPGLRIRARNLDQPAQGGEVDPGGRAVFAAGRYRLETFDQSGEKLGDDAITVRMRSQTYRYSLGSLTGLRRSVLDRLPHDAAGVRLAGGATMDTGLDMSLALLGAARILGKHPEVNSDGLHSFDNEAPGASPCYCLWASEEPLAASRAVAISEAGSREAVAWRRAENVPGLPGLVHCYLGPDAPGTLMSLATGIGPTLTVATARLPNRVTLIVVTDGPKGARTVQQFLLPIGHLIQVLPGEVRYRLEGSDALRSIATMVRMIREFAARRLLGAVMDDATIVELGYAKWVDPIMGLLAGYELARRGPGEAEKWSALTGMSREQLIATLRRNLSTFFPELPDVAVLGRRLGIGGGRAGERIPVLLDGYQALEPSERSEWPPIARLDYRGPWTQWLGVVKR